LEILLTYFTRHIKHSNNATPNTKLLHGVTHCVLNTRAPDLSVLLNRRSSLPGILKYGGDVTRKRYRHWL